MYTPDRVLAVDDWQDQLHPPLRLGREILAKDVGRRGTTVPVVCPPRKRCPRAVAGGRHTITLLGPLDIAQMGYCGPSQRSLPR